MNTVTLPLWAYIGLIAYSLIFSGLFVAALAAFERERRDRDGLELSLRAVADHCFSQYKTVREELNRLEARQVAGLATPGPLARHSGLDPESTQNPRHSGPDPESTPLASSEQSLASSERSEHGRQEHHQSRHSGLDPESTQNPRHSGPDPESTPLSRHSGLDPESTDPSTSFRARPGIPKAG